MLKHASSNHRAASLEAPMQAFVALTHAAIDSGEKLIELNFRHTRARIVESSDAIRELMNARDPQTYAAFASTRAQPEFNRAMAHYQELSSIASAMQASFARILSASLQSTSAK